MSDNVGKTALIAVIAGVLFAGFLALTPRLTAGSQTTEAVGPAAVPTTVPEVAQGAISDPVVAIPGIGLGAFDGFDPEPIEEGTGPGDDLDGADAPPSYDGPQPVMDGSLTMTVELLGPREGKETVIIEDEDIVQWNFRVTNSGSEKLYGVYVYLEGTGHVSCDDTYLAPGDNTFCTASDEVWYGENTAEAWATAWTSSHLVATEIRYDFSVG